MMWIRGAKGLAWLNMVKRTISIIALVFLLTLLPVGTAAADNILAQVDVLPGIIVTSSVVTTFLVSSEAVAVDSQGARIPVFHDLLDVQVHDEKGWITLPLALEQGQSLVFFSDPGSGLQIAENRFNMPVKDLSGKEVMAIQGEVEEVRSEGGETMVTAKDVVLSLNELSANLSSADRRVGQVGISFEVKLKSLPFFTVSTQVTITKDPSAKASTAFVLTALDTDRAVADVACALNIEKANLEDGINLGQAVITMKAGRAWADRYGLDRVSIMRYTEEGQTQILDTTFQGYEGDMAVFQATSPDGLSIFGLVALVPLVASTINWAVVGGISSGGFLSLAFLLFFILWRRRRAQESALRERWPTGLRPDDWKSE